MFICKGLHCACCKTFGIGPVLVLAILYVISAQNHAAIVTFLLRALMLVIAILAVSSVLTGIIFAIFVRLTRGMVGVNTGRPSYEVRNVATNSRQTIVHLPSRSAVDNHRNVPVLYRPPNGREEERQFVISQRRDSR